MQTLIALQTLKPVQCGPCTAGLGTGAAWFGNARKFQGQLVALRVKPRYRATYADGSLDTVESEIEVGSSFGP